MRPFSSRMYPSTATFTPVVQGTGPSNGVNESWPGGGTSLACRAEPWAGSSSNARREEQPGSETAMSVMAWTLYFPADPTCKLGDKFAVLGHTLLALGPARDESGAGVLFAVDCEERI